MSEKDREGGQEHAEENVKVTDKRRFNDRGNPRDTGEEPARDLGGAPQEGKGGEAGREEKEKTGPEEIKKETGPLPAIDFPTFVLSLATSAQIQLGAFPNPVTNKVEKDLELAKQTIDIIGMLEQKTKGNLSTEEGRLMEHVLYDLRMMYVELSKKSGS